jgi:ferredoxin
MATTITSECINCGACGPECPNTAIYAGGVPWELNGTPGAAIAQDIYYIVPSKCTECVGFHDHEACAAVCPVDCCIPDPANLESEGVLLARARELHPETTFPDDAPSRFRKEGATLAPAAGGAEAATNGAAVAAKPPAAPAAAPKPAAAPAAAAPAHAAPVAAAGLAMMHLPKDIGALPGPVGEKHFPGELEDDFESVLVRVDGRSGNKAPGWARFLVQFLGKAPLPVLGAMPDSVKATLEAAIGDPSVFSRARSTALNMVFNLFLYPVLLALFAVYVLGDIWTSQGTGGWIMLGLLIATGEAAWRLREGVFHAKPASDLTYRGCWYGLALAPLGSILVRAGGKGRPTERKVAFDGFEGTMHEDKTERDRRYGTVYTVAEYSNAYLVRLEMPRMLPPSSLKRLWNLPDEMPDYDYNIVLGDNVITISASVRGETIRRLSYVSSSFPADFTTRIEFGKPVGAFKHRMRDKVLEVVVFKADAAQFQRAA